MSLMTVPEVGRLRIDPEYTPDCDWCASEENVAWVAKADHWLCDECYEGWEKQVSTEQD